MSDTEHDRLVKLWEGAVADGNYDLASTYFSAACKQADEMAISIGQKPIWGSMAETLEKLERLARGS